MEKEKQKIKGSIYDGERIIWRLLGKFVDLFYISMMWFICSLPIVTIGAATVAAYDTVVRCIRQKESGILYRFLSTFKREFKNASLCTIVCATAAAAWVLLLLYIPLMGDTALGFLFMVNAVVLGIVVLGMITWVFPVLSRFEMPLGSALGASIKLTFAHLPATLLMIGMMIVAIAACAIWLFPLMILPGLLWMFQSNFIENVFQQFSE